MNNFNSLLRDL